MPGRAGLYIVSALVVAGLFLYSAIQGHPPRVVSEWLAPIGPAVTVAVAGLWVFDRWAWRQPGIRRLLNRPVLRGTWKCELRSSYEDRAGEVIESYLVIDQTYTQICVRMLFDRSQSISMSGDLVEEKGRCVLYYVFRSEKSALEPDSNPPARGAADLKVARKPTLSLEGDYWMERGTKGALVTVGHSATPFDTFGAARAAAFD